MQVADVRKPLMSVAKICDLDHEVIFKKDGGCIRSCTTGEEIKFERHRDIYRMGVKLIEGDMVFSRPGKQQERRAVYKTL